MEENQAAVPEANRAEEAKPEFKQLTKDQQFDILLAHRQVILAESQLKEVSAALMKIAEKHIAAQGHDLKDVNLDLATVTLSPKPPVTPVK